MIVPLPILLLSIFAIIVQKSYAFSSSSSLPSLHTPHEDPSCLPSLPSSRVAEATEQQQPLHSHSILWERTVEISPNSYVNPAIELAIRAPEEGGTGIVAVNDVKEDTVVMSLTLEEVGMIDAASILDAAPKGEDAVLDMLNKMWNKELESNTKPGSENSQEGKVSRSKY